MGYRLEIGEVEHKVCAGKLYGYTSDEKLKNLKSYKYLISKGYMDGDEYFCDGYYGNIVLDCMEFIEFIKLYNEDMNEFNTYSRYSAPKDYIIENEEVKRLMQDNKDKVLQWY